jgi:hypothetical protein
VDGSVELDEILVGATAIHTNDIGSGANANLSVAQTIAAGSILIPTLSSTYTFEFTDSFTNDASKDGTPGEFTSVIANVTAPTLTPEELIDGAPIP